MYTFVAFLDDVLTDIEERVAAHAPEQGGALLGPIGQPLVTEFIPDVAAKTTGATYTPSRSLEQLVQARERAGLQLEFKGILHSHPGDMAWPSGGDHRAYRDSLQHAPWLGRLITPIVTVRQHRSAGPHELMLPSGIMSVFVAERRPGSQDGMEVRPAAVHVLPLSHDLAVAAARLDGIPAGPPAVCEVAGQLYVCGVVELAGLDLQVIAGATYPFTAPVVIAARRPPGEGESAGQADVRDGEPGESGEPAGYGEGCRGPAANGQGPAGSPLLAGLLGMVGWDAAGQPPVRALPLTWDLDVPDEARLVSSLTQRADSSAGDTAPAAGDADPVMADAGLETAAEGDPGLNAAAEGDPGNALEQAANTGHSGRLRSGPAFVLRILRGAAGHVRALAGSPRRLWGLRLGRGRRSAPGEGDGHDDAASGE